MMSNTSISGILNILKPPGMTSHDVVSFVRKTLQTKKVGHAGTLDPGASGVLPVFVGEATRVIEYNASADKTYRVHLQFGSQTDSGDDSGTVVFSSPISSFDDIALQNALLAHTGSIKQIPPMYSALKVNGQKLYDLARKGIEIEREPRPIFINSIKLIQRYYDTLHLEINCSKGTYIRTLIEDIARTLNNHATMTFLLRTKVGQFDINNSVTLENFANNPSKCLLPINTALAHLPKINVAYNQAVRITQGVATTVQEALDYNLSSEDVFSVYFQDQLLGIARLKDNRVKPIKILCTPTNNSGLDLL